jgi:uncharacterized delta-60 repeat protein
MALAGSSAIPVFAADGDLDTSFNGTGEASVLSGTAGGGNVQVLAQADGGMVLIGTTSPGFQIGVTRLHADGSTDSSFGTAGVTIIAPPSGSTPDNVAGALDSEGRIIIGATADFGDHSVIFVARLTGTGQLDSGFHSTGTLSVTRYYVTSQGDRVAGVAVYSDPTAWAARDTILIAGSMQDTFGQFNARDVAVVPLNDNGSYSTDVTVGNRTFYFDPGFDTASYYRASVPGGAGYDSATAITRRWLPGSSSELVAVTGNALSLGNLPNLGFVLELDGSLHPLNSFGASGYSIFYFAASGTAETSAIALDDSARVLVAGTDTSTAHYNLAAARIKTNGFYDTSFNGNGRSIVNFDESAQTFDSQAVAILPQHDGRVLVGAQIEPATGNYQFGLVRLTAGGLADPTFTGGTTIVGARKYPFSANNDYPTSMAFTQGEKVLLAGIVNQPNNAYGVLRAANDRIFGDGAEAPAYLPRIP